MTKQDPVIMGLISAALANKPSSSNMMSAANMLREMNAPTPPPTNAWGAASQENLNPYQQALLAKELEPAQKRAPSELETLIQYQNNPMMLDKIYRLQGKTSPITEQDVISGAMKQANQADLGNTWGSALSEGLQNFGQVLAKRFQPKEGQLPWKQALTSALIGGINPALQRMAQSEVQPQQDARKKLLAQALQSGDFGQLAQDPYLAQAVPDIQAIHARTLQDRQAKQQEMLQKMLPELVKQGVNPVLGADGAIDYNATAQQVQAMKANELQTEIDKQIRIAEGKQPLEEQSIRLRANLDRQNQQAIFNPVIQELLAKQAQGQELTPEQKLALASGGKPVIDAVTAIGSMGGKQIGEATAKELGQVPSILKQVDELEKSFDNIQKGGGGVISLAKSKLSSATGGLIPSNEMLFDTEKNLLAQTFGKLKEGGVVKEQDYARYLSQLPNSWDAPEVAKKKIDLLKRDLKTIDTSIREGLKRTGYKTPTAQPIAQPQTNQSQDNIIAKQKRLAELEAKYGRK